MIGKLSAIFLLCLLKHTVSVPMSDFFMLGSGTFSTLGDAEEEECSSVDIFTSCDADVSTVCVSLPEILFVK